jgi:hypothetical protein
MRIAAWHFVPGYEQVVPPGQHMLLASSRLLSTPNAER